MKATDQCPLCGTELSQIKLAEIQTKISQQQRQQESEQRKKLAEAESTIRQGLELQFQAKLKKASESAAKLATQKAEEQIKKIAAERDEASRKVKESELRAAEARKQALQDAEKKSRKDLAEQRVALEKDREMTLLKKEADFNRERESFQKKFRVMEQQLRKKTANEIGEGAEIDLFETLREAFQDDRIKRVRKGAAGADILWEVLYKGQLCGKIIIDSKIRQSWQTNYVTKLRQDQVEAEAEHAILSSTSFPAGKKEMCIESDVIVVNPARVVHIAYVLRQAMIKMHVNGLSVKERAGKMSKLYKFITSEAYSGKFREAGKLTQEVLDIDVEEKKAHDKIWRKRGTAAMRINHVLREMETAIASIIEASDSNEIPVAFGVDRAEIASVTASHEELVAWSKC